jgi:hypothetical protein
MQMGRGIGKNRGFRVLFEANMHVKNSSIWAFSESLDLCFQ